MQTMVMLNKEGIVNVAVKIVLVVKILEFGK